MDIGPQLVAVSQDARLMPVGAPTLFASSTLPEVLLLLANVYQYHVSQP